LATHAFAGPQGFFSARGADSGSGGAKVKLIREADTGEYFLTTDVDSNWEDFFWTARTNLPGMMMPPNVSSIRKHVTPVKRIPKSFFKDNSRISLGKPISENNGQVLRGEKEFTDAAGTIIPFVRNTLKWEIWLSPPIVIE
jgi:hypothetical protein